LQKLLLKKQESISRLYAEKYAILEELQDICDHSRTEPYVWEHDNGYGRQTTMTSEQCIFCGKIDRWGHKNSVSYRNEK